MFGFACDEKPELMPLPMALAHRTMENLAALRKEMKLPFLRPDGKSMVTVRYANRRAIGITSVVVRRSIVPGFHTRRFERPSSKN